MQGENAVRTANTKGPFERFLTGLLMALGSVAICIVVTAQVNAQIYVFEHSDYQGSYLLINKDTPWLGDAFNDKLSSLRVPAGWQVTLYEHANYQGRWLALKQDTPFVGTAFNDITSSIRIERVQIDTNLLFLNRTKNAVKIYWLDGAREVYYADLPENQTYSQPTYVDHLWRITINGKILSEYRAQRTNRLIEIVAEVVNAGPIWNNQDAAQKCNALARNRKSVWTGGWWTTEQNKMSVCELANGQFVN